MTKQTLRRLHAHIVTGSSATALIPAEFALRMDARTTGHLQIYQMRS